MKVERVRVGDVLTLQRRAVTIDPAVEYVYLGVSAGGMGCFRKSPVLGANIRRGSASEVRQGDFLYSRLFAWRGSFEIASDHEEGCLVSGEFPTFDVDRNRIDPRWLRYWLLSEQGLREVGDRSAGSTPGSRNRMREDKFLDIRVPLPPIADQRRIAARLERLDAPRRRLAHLSEHAMSIADALATSLCARPELTDTDRHALGWQRTALAEVMSKSSSTIRVDASMAYPNLGIYSFGRGVFKKPPIDGGSTSAVTLNRVRAGQFIYSRLFAFEGAYGWIPPDFDGFFVSSEFPAFDPDPQRLDARWLASYLRSPSRWAELAGASKGLGVRRQRISSDAVLAHEVWLPPISQQAIAIAWLDRIEAASRGRIAARQVIDALLPSALNEAFAGLT